MAEGHAAWHRNTRTCCTQQGRRQVRGQKESRSWACKRAAFYARKPHLQASVDLQEVKLPRVVVHDELHGASRPGSGCVGGWGTGGRLDC